MVEYINNNNGIITEAVYPEAIQMVSGINDCAWVDSFDNEIYILRSLLSTSSEHYHHHPTLMAQSLILKKMSPLWSRHGRICRLFTNCFCVFLNLPIFNQTSPSASLTVTSFCACWIFSILRIRVSVISWKLFFIVSTENSWGCEPSSESRSTTCFTGNRPSLEQFNGFYLNFYHVDETDSFMKRNITMELLSCWRFLDPLSTASHCHWKKNTKLSCSKLCCHCIK